MIDVCEKKIKEAVWSKACRLSKPELNQIVNGLLDEILSPDTQEERREVAKFEARFYSEILNRRG